MSRLLQLLLTTLKHPLPWLLVQLISVFLWLQAGGLLEPEIVPDTPSYRMLANAPTLERALSSHRTYGYPLFLKAIGYKADGEINGNHARYTHRTFRKIPSVHAVIFLGAILLFWWSVRVYTGSAWLAFAMATPLPYAAIWGLVRRVQPDFLGAALGLLTVSLFILSTKRPRALIWAGLTVTLFLTYQVRPAYLFLVALLPLVGPVLWWVAHGEPGTRFWRFELGLIGVTALPLLLFFSLRWFVVGEFGLVPFGGHNAIGIAATFLDRDVTRSLDRHREFAREILRKRESRELEPMPLGADTVLWYGQHNKNVWGIAVPAAMRRVGARPKQRRLAESPGRAPRIEANQLLTELSADIIRRKPLHYLQWVRDSLLHCLNRAFTDPWIRWLAILLVLSVPFRLLVQRGPGLLSLAPGDLERRRGLLALAALGFSFFFAHALIVVLVDVPYERFVWAMHLLIPSVLLGAFFELWRPNGAP